MIDLTIRKVDMKKGLLFSILAIMLLAAVSCSQDKAVSPNDEEHLHCWSSGVVSKPKTCKENGEKYQVCLECGEVRCIEIKAAELSHSWDEGKLEQPMSRSLADGDIKRILTCTECGEVHETQILEKKESFFSSPIRIIIPYSPGGTAYVIAEKIKDVVNILTPYEDVSIESKTKRGGDCMGAVDYLTSEVDHASEVFLFPCEFFYRTDEEAVAAQEKIVPVVSIADTPALLFTKEGRFDNFREFAEYFRGKTIKAGRAQQGASNYRNYNLSALAKSLGMTIEFIGNYPNIESAIEGLDKGAIDVYVAFSTRETDQILQDKVDALAVFDDSDYLVTDGKTMKVIPNVEDLGYPEASFEMGYVIAMNKEELQSKRKEMIDAVEDAMLTPTLKNLLGYIFNPAGLNGEELIHTIDKNKGKANM